MEAVLFVGAIIALLAWFFEWPKLNLSDIGRMWGKPPYSKQVSKRFARYYHDLSLIHNGITLAKLAEKLGYDDDKFIMHLAKGNKDISFDQLDDFCDRAMICKDWFKHGEWGPYATMLESEYNPYHTIGHLIERWPERLGFVRSEGDLGEVLLVGQYDDFRWKIFPMAVHFSHNNGGTGARQLSEFYQFADYVKKQLSNDCVSFGRTISESLYRKLRDGQEHPGIHFSRHYPIDRWWSDFTHLSDEFPEHGRNFQDAREIIMRQFEVNPSFRDFVEKGGHEKNMSEPLYVKRPYD